MFEVEQKFDLSVSQRALLLDAAAFMGEKRIADTYFDTPTHDLTKKDYWLRCRNAAFELKTPMHVGAHVTVETYNEIEDEAEIRRVLALTADGEMRTALTKSGFEAFCECETSRKTYTKEGFTIVLDETTYASSSWMYAVCEIELLVAAPDQMAEASRKIVEFAERHGLHAEHHYGKIVEFLLRERPEHFEALVRSGVVTRKES